MKFTFGVCTYNSENFILETLESIKYQIESYGDNWDVTLVVSDDASSDKTVELVKEWCQRNEGIFEDCILLASEKNQGIAHNYARIVSNIKTEYFKTIDGDDIISSCNIFEQIIKINDDNMSVFFPIRFTGVQTYVKDADYADMYYYYVQKHNHRKDVIMFETVKPFITPEVCLRRKYLTDACLEFVKEYIQFEDDTSLFYILKNNMNMTIDFYLEPMILYRVHDRSLSNGVESAHQIKFLDDLHRFKRCLLHSEKNIFIKIIIFLVVCDTFRMKHRFSAKKSLYRRYCNKCEYRRKKAVDNLPCYNEYIEKMNIISENEMKHIKLLNERANEFRESLRK